MVRGRKPNRVSSSATVGGTEPDKSTFPADVKQDVPAAAVAECIKSYTEGTTTSDDDYLRHCCIVVMNHANRSLDFKMLVNRLEYLNACIRVKRRRLCAFTTRSLRRIFTSLQGAPRSRSSRRAVVADVGVEKVSGRKKRGPRPRNVVSPATPSSPKSPAKPRSIGRRGAPPRHAFVPQPDKPAESSSESSSDSESTSSSESRIASPVVVPVMEEQVVEEDNGVGSGSGSGSFSVVRAQTPYVTRRLLDGITYSAQYAYYFGEQMRLLALLRHEELLTHAQYSTLLRVVSQMAPNTHLEHDQLSLAQILTGTHILRCALRRHPSSVAGVGWMSNPSSPAVHLHSGSSGSAGAHSSGAANGMNGGGSGVSGAGRFRAHHRNEDASSSSSSGGLSEEDAHRLRQMYIELAFEYWRSSCVLPDDFFSPK